MFNWIYDEYKHCGVDYSDTKLVDKYDDQHQKFRNYEKEFHGIIDFLALKNTEDLTVIDLGCGTGATSIFAAKRFKKVYGVDVSEAMTRQAKMKLSDNKLNNVDFYNAGFLSYKNQGEPVDLLITKHAFHHLPDFWKQIALLRMNEMIKPGGILCMVDVVFDFAPEEYEEKINGWILNFGKNLDKEMKEEVETHIREEHSTFKWVLDTMIEKAGFKIEKCRSNDGFVTAYHCVKVKEIW